MIWCAVYEDIYGPKLRELYHYIGCSEPEAIGFLVALWFFGLHNADKDGFLAHAGREEIERHLYSRAAGSILDPKKIVDALLATGWLEEGDNGISIHDWSTWQNQWYKALDRREKDRDKKREKRHPENYQHDSDDDTPEEVTDNTAGAEEPVPPEKTKKQEYSKDFEVFWSEYPRKLGKGEAYKKYLARKKDGFSADELLIAAKNYAAACRKRGTEAEFIKHAKTFLSDNTPFTDYLPKEEERIIVKGISTGNPFEKYLEDE